MKKIYTLVLALFLSIYTWAQAPQKMSYQAVIRNNSNALVTSSPIGMQISILQGSATGSVVYTETLTTSTNANGLVSIEIGNGTAVTGTFSAINWANGPYFIKTETDPTGGNAYTISGTSELLSVPYALHAKTAERISGGITETDPVFVASPANSITSADINNWNNKLSSEVDGSVTNEIQSLTISNDTVYLSNGGYVKLPAGFNGDYNNLTNKPTAVSSFSNDAGYLTSFTEVDGSITNELQSLRISNDTIYLSNGGYTKLPAGFNGDYNSLTNKPTAVSSFSNDAGYLTSFTEVDGSITNELQTLRVSNDTIYLSNGGFVKLPATNAWNLNGNSGLSSSTNFIGTTDNTALTFRVNNQKAGRLEAGSNSFFGFESGLNYTSGADNTAIGYKTLAATNARSGNTAIGSWALSSNTSDRNTAIGFGTMQNNVTGQWNTAVGSGALITNNSGSHNTAIGGTALQSNISGAANAALGYGALLDHQSGDANTSIGMYALKGNVNGANNVGIGFESGYNNVSGTGNIFLGYRSGYNETGSNKLYIANSATTTPLIYGDFTNGRVGLGTTTPTFKLEVTDDALFNGVRVGAGNGANFQNAVLGYQALQSNTTGHFNTAIGYQVMYPNTTGDYNTAVGTAALGGNTTGGSNCAFGYASLVTRVSSTDNAAYGTNSLRFGSTGDKNSAFGSSALLNNGGNNNTAIGFQTGQNNYSGSGNVFLGYQAGYNEAGSNKLYIANSSTTTPLIYGDFTNGNVGIGTTTVGERLVVQGNHTDGRIATFQNAYDEKYITVGQILTDDGGYIKYKKSSNYTGIGVHGHTEQLIVNGSGNVGIGTTSPTAKLQVEAYGFSNKTIFGMNSLLIQSQTPSSRTLLALAPNGTQNADFVIFHNSDYTTNYESITIGYENTLNNFIIGTSKGGSGTARRLVIEATGASSDLWKQLVLATNGNVGIGTLTPSAKFEVNGAIKITGGTSSQFLKADGSLDNNTYLTAITEVADEFSATASQTSFTLTQTPSANSKVKMYVNGVRISNTAYTITDTTLTYIPANNGSYSLSVGDRIQFDYSY